MELKRNRMIPALVLASLVLMGTGTAIWLSGFQAEGNIIAVTTEPDYMVFELGTFDISAGNSTNYFTYDNPNSEAVINMTLDINEVVSTSGTCHYTEGVDFVVQIENSYGSYENIANGESIQKTVYPGATNITVRLSPHEGICPIEGNITITGELI